jgi:Aldehyde dehydrogenase family
MNDCTNDTCMNSRYKYENSIFFNLEQQQTEQGINHTTSTTTMTVQQQCIMSNDNTSDNTLTTQLLFTSIRSSRELAVLFVLFILCVFGLLHKFWTEWNIGYNLKLLKEYFFSEPIHTIDVSIPSIKINDNKKCTEIYDPARPDKIQCFNPSTNEWLGEVIVMNENDINSIIEKASIAQKQWCTTTYEQRRRVLRTIQQYIVDNVQTICTISSIDSGKAVIDAALGEVITTTEKIRTICAYGELWLQPEYRSVSPMLSHKIASVEYTPFGIIATIAPWNYPYVSY